MKTDFNANESMWQSGDGDTWYLNKRRKQELEEAIFNGDIDKMVDVLVTFDE